MSSPVPKIAGTPRRRTQKERSAATQSELLDATIDCIIDLGYAATSTTEICRRAGVSRGAQVHHFPTKAELVAAAIEHLFSRRHEEFRASLARQSSLDDALADLWDLYSGPTLLAWMELVIAARNDPTLRHKLAKVDERFFVEAKETCLRLLGIESMAEPTLTTLTRLLLATLDGLALNHMIRGHETPAAGVLMLLKQLLATVAHR